MNSEKNRKKIVNVGLVGCGTIGDGVVRLLKKGLGKRRNIEVRLKRIVDLNPNIPKYPGITTSKNLNDILNDSSIHIGVELIGGYEPALTIQKKILESGKHLVTANKAVISKFGPKIFSLAQSRGLSVGYEASVCGSIPIIHVLSQNMPNKIKSILGILNGSTNYILTQMENKDYKLALKEAQEKGFAEKNPSFDVEGLDSAQKLAILTQIVFRKYVNPDKIITQGITGVSRSDMRFARDFGYAIKLLAIARNGKKLELRVHPTMIPQNHFLSSVRDEFNAVYVEGAATGPQVYLGKGAGKEPTANAVISDLLTIAAGAIYSPPVYEDKKTGLLSGNEFQMEYYLRFTVLDKPGVLAKISNILGRHSISIASVIQKGSGHAVPLVMITHQTRQGNLLRALPLIKKLDVVRDEPIVIPVMNL